MNTEATCDMEVNVAICVMLKMWSLGMASMWRHLIEAEDQIKHNTKTGKRKEGGTRCVLLLSCCEKVPCVLFLYVSWSCHATAN